jgi:thioredoxin 1
MVHEIETQDEFDEKVAETKGLVLVDFYAQWCGPCKRFAPRLQQLSAMYTNVSFYKVDVEVDDLANVVRQESISAMPTFVLYRDGTEVGRVTGADENKLVSLLTTQ